MNSTKSLRAQNSLLQAANLLLKSYHPFHSVCNGPVLMEEVHFHHGAERKIQRCILCFDVNIIFSCIELLQGFTIRHSVSHTESTKNTALQSILQPVALCITD